MKAYPRITVVLQCFNRAGYIGETIESVLNQGYPNLELIVIDDDSSDNSWEVIQRYQDRLAYAERWPGKRANPVPALNRGLARGTGEIMTTLNDKNLLMHKSLFTVAEVFTAFPDVEWVTGIGLIANPEGMITNVVPLRKDLHEHLIGTRHNIQHESTFWRRSLWERAGGAFNEESWSFDNDLWARFFMAGARLYHLNTILGAYRKLATAHGVAKKDEYYHWVEVSRRMLRAHVPKKELVYAELYRALWWLKPLLRNIPDRVWARLPILNHFCHESIRFENVTAPSGSLVRYKRNPFRIIFPW
jgi:glycosyltransferase involved in cell wall biosynthesis